MVLTLKVVWTSDSGESEIRRVTVNEDVISRYNLLADKVVRLFPQLSGQHFQLGWKDSEGDYIVMSSDEELAQAVANTIENGLIKIFVAVKTSKNADQIPKSSVVHPHVICDACNGNVCGYRYKCLECLDYDLCESCHLEDKHPGHDMLKICMPVGQAHSWMFPGWRRMYRSMFGQHPFGGRCARKWESKHGEESEKKGKKTSTASSPHADFLKNIGKSVAFFLDPLGIDVDVMVSESEGDSSSPSGPKKEAESQPETEETEPKNMAEENVRSDEKNDADNKSDSLKACSEQLANTAAPQNDSSAESSGQGARPKNYGLFQGSNSGCDVSVDSGENREPSPDLNGHDEWTVVNDLSCVKDEQNETAVKSSASCEKVRYPELPDEKMPSDVGVQSDMPAHPDPKIANALSKMCAMGFTNEGGWLVRLLETKNGNINDVLDALYPNRH